VRFSTWLWCRPCTVATFAGLALALPSPALAEDELQTKDVPYGEEDDSEDGPEFAVRSGYASPFGQIERDVRVRDSVAGAVPFWIDVGYRLDRNWFIGIYGHYGLGIASGTSDSDCPNCQHSWVRFGLQAQHRWLLDARRAVWIGLGIGRESFNTSIDPVLSSSRSISGWELFNWQFGCDYRPTTGVTVGPYFSLSFDAFSTKTLRCGDDDCPRAARSVSTDLHASGVHGWVNAGLRVVFLP
jgi:hypothetical protein